MNNETGGMDSSFPGVAGAGSLRPAASSPAGMEALPGVAGVSRGPDPSVFTGLGDS